MKVCELIERLRRCDKLSDVRIETFILGIPPYLEIESVEENKLAEDVYIKVLPRNTNLP